MSKLDKLYEMMTNLKELGLSINDDLIEEANALEEDIIKKDILPVLTKTIEPALKPVQRELVLVVDYVPGRPLSVHLSRKSNFAAEIPDAVKIAIDPEVEHVDRESHDKKIKRRPTGNFSVTFPDGTVIAEHKAVNTLEAVVKRIGIPRVRQIVEQENLVFNKVPVISNRRDKKYGSSQRDLGNGWLLITHSSNIAKKRFLDHISDALGLGLKVELNDQFKNGVY